MFSQRILIGRGLFLREILKAICLLFSFQGVRAKRAGVNGNEVPPVPIPNTEVKLIRVENTWLETTREDRSMPAPKPRVSCSGFCFLGLFSRICLDFSAILWYNILTGVSPSGKAPDFDSGIRRFKSCYPNPPPRPIGYSVGFR